tara:strand:+ start:686 stop:898 length:213 start_codon:yes stop_codon:yes gene_type:complete
MFRLKGIKSTNPIAVGDKVNFELEAKNNTQTGVINQIEERKNYIVRKLVNLSKQTHTSCFQYRSSIFIYH